MEVGQLHILRRKNVRLIGQKIRKPYVDEFVFRYNNRKEPAEMFQRMLKQISQPLL